MKSDCPKKFKNNKSNKRKERNEALTVEGAKKKPKVEDNKDLYY